VKESSSQTIMPSVSCRLCDGTAQSNFDGLCRFCFYEEQISTRKYWECNRCKKKVPNGTCNRPLVQCNNCRQKKPKINPQINDYGNVIGFGSGDSDLLGPIGDDYDVLTPRLLVDVLELNIIQVACGADSSLALTEKGEVFAWGGDIKSPVQIEGFKSSIDEPEARINHIQQGSTHFLALSSAGDIYVGGKYTHCCSGQTFQHISNNDNDVWPVHYLAGIKAKRIFSGEEFCAALLEDSTIITWGVASEGLARPVPLLEGASDKAINEDYLHPKPPLWDSIANAEQKVLSVACGFNHLLVVTEGCVVYSSGANHNGQLGHGDINSREKLTQINALLGQDIAVVAAGKAFSFFVDQSGKQISACGTGCNGQLGLPVNGPIPHEYHEEIPCRVPLVYHSNAVEEDQPIVRHISCGRKHVLVITESGDAYSWGCANFGKCGHGISEGIQVRPKKLESKWISKFLYMSAGIGLSLAVAVVDEECLSATKQMAKLVRKHNHTEIGKVVTCLDKIVYNN
jgi:alpha-tubulin suppressor-like RCC1 family protein